MEQQLISSVRYVGVVPMIIIALMLALKNRGRVQSAVYNRSRWLLVAATLLLAAHFLIQYVGHLREQSVTLCWAVNLAFYVVITPLYNLAEQNLLRAGHRMKWRYWHNAISVALCYVLLAIGYFTHTLINDAQPWLTATFIVALLYFLKVIELSWMLGREMKVADSRLTDQELSHRHQALRYTARVMRWIILLSLLSPWVGMSASLVLNSIYGMAIFVLLIWFQIKFLHYGENMAECIEVNDEILEAAMIETETTSENEDALQRFSAESSMTDLEQRIEQWLCLRRFTDPSLTISEALKEMNVSASALNFYLESHTTIRGYRKWLPYLRVEEAKKVMREHPKLSLEAVADACGYSDRSTLSRAFKKQEGISPKDWAKNITKE